MMLKVGIDVGGTFTDFVALSEEGGIQLTKTPTTHYDLSVGTNALIERTGPKLGLLTTAGFEDTIFIGRSRSWADGGSMEANRNLARIRKAEPPILPEMVVGI